jgi:hypothetical protein
MAQQLYNETIEVNAFRQFDAGRYFKYYDTFSSMQSKYFSTLNWKFAQ